MQARAAAVMSDGVAASAALLDRARGHLLGAVGRWPATQALARGRGLRLCFVAVVGVALAWLGVALVPLLMLALAPIAFGVPHVAADVRYLLLRRATIAPRARLPLLLAAIACTTAAALGKVALMGASGWLGVALAAALADGAPARRLWAAAAAVALGVVSLALPSSAALTMAQAHNFIAVALALWLVRAKMRAPWLPALAFGAGCAAIAGGLLDGALATAFARASSGLAAAAPVGVVPAGASSTAALRWLGLFAFAQAVHYAVWLRLVPDGERAGEKPIGYRRSLALLGHDFGRAALPVLALALAVPLLAAFSLVWTRSAYFSLAAFHGYLELAFVASLVSSASGRPERACVRTAGAARPWPARACAVASRRAACPRD
jgi:hypothetical protein